MEFIKSETEKIGINKKKKKKKLLKVKIELREI